MKLNFIFCFFFLFLSCNDLPSDYVIQDIVKNKINEKSYQKAELTEFKISNKTESAVFQPTYQVNFEGKIKFLESGFIRPASLQGFEPIVFHFLNINENLDNMDTSRYHFIKINKGMIKNITGSISFIKGTDLFEDKEPKPYIWNLDVKKRYDIRLSEAKTIDGSKKRLQ